MSSPDRVAALALCRAMLGGCPLGCRCDVGRTAPVASRTQVSSIDVDEEEEEVEDDESANDLSNADVVTKYRTAGTIANEAQPRRDKAAALRLTA